ELGLPALRLSRGRAAESVLDDAIARLEDSEPELRELLEAELINSAGFDTAVIEVSRERIRRIDEDALVGEVGSAVMAATLRYFDARRGTNREAVSRVAQPQSIAALINSMPSVAISCAATALMYA